MAHIDKRTSKNGKVTHRVRVRLKGHPLQTATFTRLTDATRWAQLTETAIREGRPSLLARIGRSLTLRDRPGWQGEPLHHLRPKRIVASRAIGFGPDEKSSA